MLSETCSNSNMLVMEKRRQNVPKTQKFARLQHALTLKDFIAPDKMVKGSGVAKGGCAKDCKDKHDGKESIPEVLYYI